MKYKLYISVATPALEFYLKNIQKTIKILEGIPCKQDETFIILTLLTYREKIVPKISISNEYTTFDHRFPNVQYNKHNCITVFLHCNIRTVQNDIKYLNEQYLNYLMPQEN